MNQLRDELEKLKLKEHIQEKEIKHSAIPLISNLLNMFVFVKQWLLAKIVSLAEERIFAIKQIKRKTKKFRVPLWIARKAKASRTISKKNKANKNTQPRKILSSKVQSISIPEDANKSHLYIIDTRYVGYGKDSLIKLIMRIGDSASKIIVLFSTENPTGKEMKSISQCMEIYDIELIRTKNKKRIRDRRLSLVGEGKKAFYKVTILESININEAITYKNNKLKPIPKLLEKHTAKTLYTRKITISPSMAEIQEMQRTKEKKENLIVWDLENISYKYIDAILEKLHKKGHIVLVSVEPLVQKIIDILFPYILLYGIEIFTDHGDSDEKIKEILFAKYKGYKAITVVSSDTDFIPTIREILERGKHVMVISRDLQKKGMLMRLKIDHRNLQIRTL